MSSDTLDTAPAATAGPPLSRQREGVALCLSGGGYRAMLFHCGALIRLNELGWLPRLNFISSVSGGSIAAGVLGQHWHQLRFDDNGFSADLEPSVIAPIIKLAGRSLDVRMVLGGLLPGRTAAQLTVKALDKHVFKNADLQSLPDSPRFIITAANLQTGSLWRFSKKYMRDYRIGKVDTPDVSLALAVAASAGFPPVLCPVELDIERCAWVPATLEPALPGADEWPPPRILLGDGGVYDNLGLQPVIQRAATILVSDGGQQMGYSARIHRNWPMLMSRVLNLIDNQVRSQRKSNLIDGFIRTEYQGAYWGIGTDIADYRLNDVLHVPVARSRALAAVPTRLRKTPTGLQNRLINLGYAITDAAMRSRLKSNPPSAPAPTFPRAGGVG